MTRTMESCPFCGAVNPNRNAIRAETLEEAARLIERHVIQDTSCGKVLVPRQDGNRDGLHYAVAIRVLADTEGSAE